jgi:hypothetical protein
VDEPLTHVVMAPFRNDRGPEFYQTALAYAASLWLQGLPARSLLQINRAFSADFTGDEAILKRWPLPYAAAAWVIANRPQLGNDFFIGNPRRHYQHLATRMVPPRQEQRTCRAWACWYLSVQLLPADQFPADEKQIAEEGITEPSEQDIATGLQNHGVPGECAVWQSVVASLPS